VTIVKYVNCIQWKYATPIIHTRILISLTGRARVVKVVSLTVPAEFGT